MTSSNVVLAVAASASSTSDAPNVDIVVLSGTVSVFIPDRLVTSLSIRAHAAVTLVVSVTSANASIHASLDISPAVVNLLVVDVSSKSSGSRTTAHVDQLTLNT